MKACTTCKYGYDDERLGIPMCHHPKRFSEDCVDFNMHEEKEIKESEKPMDQEDIDTEIGHWMDRLDDKYCLLVPHYSIQDIKDTALHFAEWGAEHAREQMMKEAVEGEVIVPIYGGDDTWSAEIKIPGRYAIGDKVRIIVIPNTDEK